MIKKRQAQDVFEDWQGGRISWDEFSRTSRACLVDSCWLNTKITQAIQGREWGDLKYLLYFTSTSDFTIDAEWLSKALRWSFDDATSVSPETRGKAASFPEDIIDWVDFRNSKHLADLLYIAQPNEYIEHFDRRKIIDIIASLYWRYGVPVNEILPVLQKFPKDQKIEADLEEVIHTLRAQEK